MSSHGPLRRQDSQETSSSLLQLDPSPITSPPVVDTNKELSALAPARGMDGATSLSPTTGPPGLSGSRYGAVYYLTRIQKYSSYALSLFTGLHLVTVSLIPAVTRSVAASETYLLMTREIYQTTLTEPLLIALPAVAHVGSGVALRLVRRCQNVRRYGGSGAASSSPWPPLSYISRSGYVFSLFFAGHVFMNRLLPLAVEGDSSNIGLAYVAHAFARHPFIVQLAYSGLILAGSWHMVWGAARWLGVSSSSRDLIREDSKVFTDKPALRRRRKRWLSISAAAVGTSLLWALGGMGVVAKGGAAEGWIGRLYDDLFARAGLN